MSPVADDGRFRLAARAYGAYAIVYWIGGVYLVWHGVGVPGPLTDGRRNVYVAFWAIVGLVPLLVIPYLLRRRRGWFERWLLSRRDFARILTVFMLWRAIVVLRVAVRPVAASVAAPWGEEAISFRLGAVVFFVFTVTALVLIARAAWSGGGADT